MKIEARKHNGKVYYRGEFHTHFSGEGACEDYTNIHHSNWITKKISNKFFQPVFVEDLEHEVDDEDDYYGECEYDEADPIELDEIPEGHHPQHYYNNRYIICDFCGQESELKKNVVDYGAFTYTQCPHCPQWNNDPITVFDDSNFRKLMNTIDNENYGI